MRKQLDGNCQSCYWRFHFCCQELFLVGFCFCSIFSQGKVWVQSFTTTNYSVEFPTFGEITGFSASGKQLSEPRPGKTTSWSWHLPCQVSISRVWIFTFFFCMFIFTNSSFYLNRWEYLLMSLGKLVNILWIFSWFLHWLCYLYYPFSGHSVVILLFVQKYFLTVWWLLAVYSCVWGSTEKPVAAPSEWVHVAGRWASQ